MILNTGKEAYMMRLMTFNTQHCRNFLTGEIDFQKMADTVMMYNPDIVGLNEMRGLGVDKDFEAQVDKLAERTGMPYFYFAKAIDIPNRGPYGNGILSKIPILSLQTTLIPIPQERLYDGYYETRCALKAELEGGITVIITHMGLNPDEEENAVRTVVENITEKKCILMGDFNVEPDNGILLPIYERMTDTAEKFQGEKLSFPSDAPTCKIDYIFVSRDATVLEADIPEIIASDHRPHVATVVFNEE